ncbi:uncharacterized protein LOC144166175 isoform X2 [Haemaphysalis longicornis]
MTRNSPSKSDRSSPPSSYNRTDTDNSRRGSRKSRSHRSHSDSRSRSRSRSRDRGGSRSKKSSRSHRRHNRSRSRERSSRRDRSHSRSRSHRRSRSRSGSQSRDEDRAPAQRKAFAGASEAAATRAASMAAGSVQVAALTAAAVPSPALVTSVASSVTPMSVASAMPPAGVSAALAAARAAAIRSGLMPVEALSAPPPLTITGALPSYYNPTQVNALKYSEQMQKRKLLWKKPQAEGTGSTPPEAPADKQQQPSSTCAKVWERMTFAEDQDGKVTAKFRKLMGIRGDPPPPTDKPDPAANPLLKQQEKLFHDLDQQYEAARVSTHTHRGVGLGYSSQVAAYYQQQAASLHPK